MMIDGEKIHGDVSRHHVESLETAQKNILLPKTPFEWEEFEPNRYRATVEVVKENTVRRWDCLIVPE